MYAISSKTCVIHSSHICIRKHFVIRHPKFAIVTYMAKHYPCIIVFSGCV